MLTPIGSDPLIGAMTGLGTLGADPTPVFSDVPGNSPIYAATLWLKQRGITAGCGDGKYCPDDPVTRGQMALFLHRALAGGSTPGVGSGSTDTDTGGGIGNFLKDNKLLIGGAVVLVLVMSMGKR